MKQPSQHAHSARTATAYIRSRIERAGERLWRLEDFQSLPATAVAQALSRLARQGELERLSKGVYYRHRQTAFGPSKPNPATVLNLARRRNTVYPAGVAAANLLGFSTQSAKQAEVATSASSLPRKLVGDQTVIHTRRPEAWKSLSETDVAMLDFLRRGGRTSELSPDATIKKTIALLSEPGRFRRFLKIAQTEPPRVRAMLGALGAQLGQPAEALRKLQLSLNPYSRFDFGVFARLPLAHEWQAKEIRRREAL